MIKEINTEIDYVRLLNEFESLNLTQLLTENKNQIAVQHGGVNSNSQLTDSCNSLVYDWGAYDSNIHKTVPVHKNIRKENEFTITCDLFKNTYISEVIDKLKKEHNVYRGRFMLSKYKTCLSMHTDPTPRLHIPIITNSEAFMVVDNTVVRLPFGKTYIVDTRLMHTAINAGIKDRVHLVFCVDDF
jgi:hypothetical protein